MHAATLESHSPRFFQHNNTECLSCRSLVNLFSYLACHVSALFRLAKKQFELNTPEPSEYES